MPPRKTKTMSKYDNDTAMKQCIKSSNINEWEKNYDISLLLKSIRFGSCEDFHISFMSRIYSSKSLNSKLGKVHYSLLHKESKREVNKKFNIPQSESTYASLLNYCTIKDKCIDDLNLSNFTLDQFKTFLRTNDRILRSNITDEDLINCVRSKNYCTIVAFKSFDYSLKLDYKVLKVLFENGTKLVDKDRNFILKRIEIMRGISNKIGSDIGPILFEDKLCRELDQYCKNQNLKMDDLKPTNGFPDFSIQWFRENLISVGVSSEDLKFCSSRTNYLSICRWKYFNYSSNIDLEILWHMRNFKVSMKDDDYSFIKTMDSMKIYDIDSFDVVVPDELSMKNQSAIYCKPKSMVFKPNKQPMKINKGRKKRISQEEKKRKIAENGEFDILHLNEDYETHLISTYNGNHILADNGEYIILSSYVRKPIFKLMNKFRKKNKIKKFLNSDKSVLDKNNVVTLPKASVDCIRLMNGKLEAVRLNILEDEQKNIIHDKIFDEYRMKVDDIGKSAKDEELFNMLDISFEEEMWENI